MIHIIYLQKK